MEDYVTIDMPPSLWKLYVGNGKTKRKSPEYKNWIQVAHWQLNQQKKIIGKVDGKFRIHLLLSRSRASCDLDNYIKPVLDVLQSYGVIENDKFCEESTQKWHYLSDHVCFLKIERIEEEMFADFSSSRRSIRSINERSWPTAIDDDSLVICAFLCKCVV